MIYCYKSLFHIGRTTFLHLPLLKLHVLSDNPFTFRLPFNFSHLLFLFDHLNSKLFHLVKHFFSSHSFLLKLDDLEGTSFELSLNLRNFLPVLVFIVPQLLQKSVHLPLIHHVVAELSLKKLEFERLTLLVVTNSWVFRLVLFSRQNNWIIETIELLLLFLLSTVYVKFVNFDWVFHIHDYFFWETPTVLRALLPGWTPLTFGLILLIWGKLNIFVPTFRRFFFIESLPLLFSTLPYSSLFWLTCLFYCVIQVLF